MAKVMKARRGGFTLVELLIVIIIIAILAGMLLLATGSATDSADATKIINDLRNVKGAAMMYYVDNNEWPVGAAAGAAPTQVAAGSALLTSMDIYLDRPFFNATPAYELWIGDVTMPGTTQVRTLIGIVTANTYSSGVAKKLQQNSTKTGVVGATGAAFVAPTTGGDAKITAYMIMK